MLKTRYTIIEPGDEVVTDLMSLKWTDVTFRSNNPGYSAISLAVRPHFPGSSFERVAVNMPIGPSDIFVASNPDPRANILATAIYWTAINMHAVAHGMSADDPAAYEVIYKKAFEAALVELRRMKRGAWIHGRAMVFEHKIWS